MPGGYVSSRPNILVRSDDRQLKAAVQSLAVDPAPSASLPVDLVVLDLDGQSEASAIVQATAEFIDTPIVVVSQDSSPQRVVAAMRAGAHDWIPRPIVQRQLERVLTAALERTAARHASRSMTKALRARGQEAQDDRQHLAQQLGTMAEELDAAHRELQSRVSQLVMLYRIGRDLSSQRNWDEALEGFLRSFCDFLRADGAALLLVSESGHRLAPRSSFRMEQKTLEATCEDLRTGDMPAPRDPALWTRGDDDCWIACHESAGWSETVVPLVHRQRTLGYLAFEKSYDSWDDAQGDLYFLITVQTILTEEVAGAQALSELRRLQRFQQMTLDRVGSGILTVDAQGRVLYANATARELLQSEPTGMVLADLLQVGAERVPLDRWLAYVDGHGPAVADAWLITDPESVIPVSIAASQLPGDRPGEVHFVTILEDLRERRELEAERRRAARQDELLIMAAEWAHDVRTPLTGILHGAELLADALPADSAKRRHFRMIHSEVDRINDLVSNFLDFARPARLKAAECDLSEVARQVVEAMSGTAAARDVRVELILDGADARGFVDPGQLKQVLLNLVHNAIDASPSGDIVRVRVQREESPTELTNLVLFDGALSLEIEDGGTGVASAHLDRLFIPFFTTKSHGTGLGLAISEKIVRAHHGHLRYERRRDRTIMRAVLPAQLVEHGRPPVEGVSSPLEARG